MGLYSTLGRRAPPAREEERGVIREEESREWSRAVCGGAHHPPKKKTQKKPEGRKKKKSLKSSGAGEASSAHFKVVAPGAVFICAPAQAAPRSSWRSQWKGHGGALRPALRCASPALLLRPRGCAQGCASREEMCEQRLLQSMLRLQGARAKHVYYS